MTVISYEIVVVIISGRDDNPVHWLLFRIYNKEGTKVRFTPFQAEQSLRWCGMTAPFLRNLHCIVSVKPLAFTKSGF